MELKCPPNLGAFVGVRGGVRLKEPSHTVPIPKNHVTFSNLAILGIAGFPAWLLPRLAAKIIIDYLQLLLDRHKLLFQY